MTAHKKAALAAMARAGLSRSDTAEEMGITTQSLGRWLNGKGGNVTTLDAFAAACGTTASAILAERDELEAS